jgi:hypothetical protein
MPIAQMRTSESALEGLERCGSSQAVAVAEWLFRGWTQVELAWFTGVIQDGVPRVLNRVKPYGSL